MKYGYITAYGQTSAKQALNFIGRNEVIQQVATFPTKKEAAEFSKKRGWTPKDVRYAIGRFSCYWVVAQPQNGETGDKQSWRILTPDSWIDVV